jgi:FAD/FMN-containing dehydrogenase
MSALDQLQAILGNEGLLLPGADLARYIREPRGRFPGDPLAVARPDSTEQLARVVRICAEHRIAMVPQGGLTGLVGGGSAAQGELIISTERMRAIRELDVADASVVVEAGCPLGTLRQAVAEAGLLYPVSLASEGSATIGGTLATNAGGNLTIRHGNTRAQVLGLEVVLADGRIWSELSPLRKNNTGYDLAQLFVGSEGTLGIITAAAH